LDRRPVALSPVALIQEPSWGEVLSDLWTGARGSAGVLLLTLAEWSQRDHAEPGAERPEAVSSARKLLAMTETLLLFTGLLVDSAKLFTAAGETSFRTARLLRPWI